MCETCVRVCVCACVRVCVCACVRVCVCACALELAVMYLQRGKKQIKKKDKKSTPRAFCLRSRHPVSPSPPSRAALPPPPPSPAQSSPLTPAWFEMSSTRAIQSRSAAPSSRASRRRSFALGRLKSQRALTLRRAVQGRVQATPASSRLSARMCSRCSFPRSTSAKTLTAVKSSRSCTVRCAHESVCLCLCVRVCVCVCLCVRV